MSEAKTFIDQKVESMMLEAIMFPENYEICSFYPAPICSFLSDVLIKEMSLSKEEISEKCKHRIHKDGVQEWIFGENEVLVRAIPSSVFNDSGEEIKGIVGVKFETPYADKNKK